jgi:hypothetical protein
MRAESGAASERRLSYFNACTIERRDPSYAPIALARKRADAARRHLAQIFASRLITRQEGSGSPQ